MLILFLSHTVSPDWENYTTLAKESKQSKNKGIMLCIQYFQNQRKTLEPHELDYNAQKSSHS